MELFSRPAPTRRFPQFGSFLPVSPWIQIISMLLKNFQTLPAKTPRLKYLAILPLSLCFVTVYSKFFLKRSFLPDIEHKRGYAIITYFQTARRQATITFFFCCSSFNKKIEWPQSITCDHEYAKKITLLYAVKLV